jgi:hypothetical protein
MTRNSIITITATAALITSAITPTMAGGRGNSPGVGGGVSASRTVFCGACVDRVSHYLVPTPNPTFPISGTTGGGSAIGTGHVKCARWPC